MENEYQDVRFCLDYQLSALHSDPPWCPTLGQISDNLRWTKPRDVTPVVWLWGFRWWMWVCCRGWSPRSRVSSGALFLLASDFHVFIQLGCLVLFIVMGFI